MNAVPASAGVGLRFQHHREVLEAQPPLAWLEVHTENYLGGGPSPHTLDRVREHYPISLHGVGLSLGSACGLDAQHLEKVRNAVRRFAPGLVSEHLAWSATGAQFLPDLLPLPMTDEALQVVCRNVDQMQTALGRSILLENPSSYVQFAHSTIPEWEFLAEVARRTGCGLLCDVNNIYVSASNHGWDARHYIRSLPADRVGEIHLAGHSTRQLASGATLRVDDHGSAVCNAVWNLYAVAIKRFGPVPTLIEWDNDVPALDVLLVEARKADDILEGCCRVAA
jgi:uncharacterized protein (UPF0276 family)